MITSSAIDPMTRATDSTGETFRADIVALQAERGGELWGLARHLGLSPDEAEDAVQEALLRLWTVLRDGAAIERMDAWAFRSLYRRRGRCRGRIPGRPEPRHQRRRLGLTRH
jgi:DNA-directed RNA polymerase specialized sigma24 family protein